MIIYTFELFFKYNIWFKKEKETLQKIVAWAYIKN